MKLNYLKFYIKNGLGIENRMNKLILERCEKEEL